MQSLGRGFSLSFASLVKSDEATERDMVAAMNRKILLTRSAEVERDSKESIWSVLASNRSTVPLLDFQFDFLAITPYNRLLRHKYTSLILLSPNDLTLTLTLTIKS